MALNHIGIKAVHGLSVGHHDVVGDVDDIINRTQPHGAQFVLQPLGTLFDVAVADAHASIALASLVVFNLHGNRKRLVVHAKRLAIGTMQPCLIAILLEPSIEIARHAIVRKRIATVGRDVNLYQPIALHVIIFCSRSAHHRIVGQHNDAVVRRAHTNFVFGTNHAHRLHAAQFALLDSETFIAIIEHAAQIGHNHLLPGGHIGSAANNLARHIASQINLRDVQVVAVGMGLAREHLPHEKAFQTTFYGLHLFQGVNF